MKECCVNCFVTKEIELNIELPYRCCLMLGSFLVMVGTIAYFCLCERNGGSVGLVFCLAGYDATHTRLARHVSLYFFRQWQHYVQVVSKTVNN